MMGEFSAISFSERLLHRMTTWMFVSGWSPPALFVSSVERVEFVNFDITERERVGGLGGCIALLLIAVRGREAALGRAEGFGACGSYERAALRGGFGSVYA